MTDLLIRDVRPSGGDAVDVLMQGGKIARMAPGLAAPPGARIEEGHGGLLLPGLVEGHAHLDKTLMGQPWHRNTVGPMRDERIENERQYRRGGGHDAAARALTLARAYLANGTTRMRTHADIDTEIGLRHFHATLRTREAMAGSMDMQIVAFPQSGLTSRPGTEELMDQALREGADVVGGIDPCSVDRDPVGHVDALFRLAHKHGKPIDVHLHEPGELGAFSLNLILERTVSAGMAGMVTISHAFCLGTLATGERDAFLDRMARWDVRIATTAPASNPVPPLMVCRAAGVTVYGGNDGVRDTWTPHGRPDMLDRAMHIALRNGFRRDDELEVALECVTTAAAEGCGFAGYGLVEGAWAECVVMDAETVAEAVAQAPPRRLVVAHGRVVARDGVVVE